MRHVDRADEGALATRVGRRAAVRGQWPAAARRREPRRAAPRPAGRAAVGRARPSRRPANSSRSTPRRRVRPWSTPSNRACVALSRPIRRDAPPASTTAASGTGDVTSRRLVDGPGVFATQQAIAEPPCRAAWHPWPQRPADARHRRRSGRLHLAEDAHHDVLEVLLGQPRQRERVRRIVDLRVVHDDVVGDTSAVLATSSP